MAFDLEEQEQLASLKAWWARYGNLSSWLLIAALAAYSGTMAWNHYQLGQATQAAQLYDELQQAATAKNNLKVQRAASDMQARFGSTAYAQMSALAAAKSAFDALDLKTAKAQLQWTIEHGGDEYKTIAQLRLAAVLLDEKSYAAALTVLAGETQAPFVGAVQERRGDIFAAQNKTLEARAAYQAALLATDAKDPGRQLISLKLDAAGGNSAAAAAVLKAAQ